MRGFILLIAPMNHEDVSDTGCSMFRSIYIRPPGDRQAADETSRIRYEEIHVISTGRFAEVVPRPAPSEASECKLQKYKRSECQIIHCKLSLHFDQALW